MSWRHPKAKARQVLGQRLYDLVADRIHYHYLSPHIHVPPHGPDVIDAEQPTWVLAKVYRTTPEDGYPVKVGKYCSIHHDAYFVLGSNHATGTVSTFHFHRILGVPGEPEPPLSRGPIVVGNDVWIAWGAVVLSGVTIGDGAIVAMRALVTKDVEPYEIVGGVPARHLGWRFDEPTREALLRIRWWDWPEEVVRQRVDELESKDVAAFVDRYDPQRQPAGA
jgi:acetyltransferase-like isoleucine patch superfamily enzyme